MLSFKFVTALVATGDAALAAAIDGSLLASAVAGGSFFLAAVVTVAVGIAVGALIYKTASLFIDPSGSVLDTMGNPVAAATVTLLRGPDQLGPFAPIVSTDPGIEPNTNPEMTSR